MLDKETRISESSNGISATCMALSYSGGSISTAYFKPQILKE
jgi:hypothetical protein